MAEKERNKVKFTDYVIECMIKLLLYKVKVSFLGKEKGDLVWIRLNNTI